MGHRVTIHCPAKVNLGLEVLSRRADDYHDICTVMQAVDLYDELTVEVVDGDGSEAPDIELSGPFAGQVPPTGNTLLAAWAVAGGNRLPALRVSLAKHIPAGAGLGGGSSNGAGMLLALREIKNLERADPRARPALDEIAPGGAQGRPPSSMLDLAARNSSDAPFFLGPPCQLATGRGELLTPVDRKLDFHLVLAVPHFGSATGPAYAALCRHQGPVAPLVVPQLARAMESGNLNLFKASLVNDFETLLRLRHPKYAQWFDALNSAGALAVSLTGSGSGFYGLFENASSAQSASRQLRSEGFRYLGIHRPLTV